MTNTHVQIKNALSYIDYCMSIIDITGADRKVLFDPSNRTASSIIANILAVSQGISKRALVDIITSVRGVAYDVRINRRNRASANPYMFVSNMAHRSRTLFESLIISSLDLDGILVDVASTFNSGPYELDSKHLDRKYGKVRITIPCHWCKTVHDRGIAIVNANDGPRVVISAARKKVERLNDMNIQVFKGQAMGFKKRLKKYWLHDAWIMKMEAEDNVITALHEDFTKAEQLINRRIRKAVTEALNV